MKHSNEALHYRVEAADRDAHLFQVTLTIPRPAAEQRVMLPVWIPGSYLVREFARHLQGLQARQGARACRVIHEDKCSWTIECDPSRPLQLHYQVWARDASVRAAWLDTERGFFNATSLCLRVEGAADACRHELQIVAPDGARRWRVATALRPVRVDARGFGRYTAADYDELADSPVEMGDFWSGEFDACGVKHRFVVSGASANFDGERLLADAQRICSTAIRFWHPRGRPPHDRYVFLLRASADGYGGLEHRHSTALMCARRDLPRLGEAALANEGYVGLLGLISHEYFHTWNVKRLRPRAFERYDYARENYTDLLWFFEGFTSYYDDLLLRRAGLIDDETYLKLLAKTINQVQQTPGRRVQSLAEASFDAWIKYYRPDENTPNATVSYYTKGALVGLCLDLSLRTEGAGSLDAVLRMLWRRSRGGPIDEADVRAALAEVGARDHAAELDAWVHGTDELPLSALLERHGVETLAEPGSWAQRLGVRASESGGTVKLSAVLRGSVAERAGLAAGDEWLGIEGVGETAGGAWRLNKLDELTLHLRPDAASAVAWVSRDGRLLRLPIDIPPNAQTVRLRLADADAAHRWLGAAPARTTATG
jgi:predicted metalloprotease with PDZ domain